MYVFLLYQQNDEDYEDRDCELIGVFETETLAEVKAPYPILTGSNGYDENGRDRYYYRHTCWIEKWDVQK